jgi:rhodanese-related sulfurtransferase
MGFFSKLFGPKVDWSDLIHNQKARIVDVRTPAEFKGGHIKGSINIPLNSIGSADKKLKGDQPIIVVCASGMRSGQALQILKGKGLNAVYNGGGWRSLQRHM